MPGNTAYPDLLYLDCSHRAVLASAHSAWGSDHGVNAETQPAIRAAVDIPYGLAQYIACPYDNGWVGTYESDEPGICFKIGVRFSYDRLENCPLTSRSGAYVAFCHPPTGYKWICLLERIPLFSCPPNQNWTGPDVSSTSAAVLTPKAAVRPVLLLRPATRSR